LTAIATGKKPQPPEVDRFAQSFGVAGEKQEKVVDEATAVLLGKLPLDSDIQKAKAAFDEAQSVEENFQRDFNGVDSRIGNDGPVAPQTRLQPLRNARLNDPPIRQNDNEVHLLRRTLDRLRE
jgi:hypothetical protein